MSTSLYSRDRCSGLDENVLLTALADGHQMEKTYVRPDLLPHSFLACVKSRSRNDRNVSIGQFFKSILGRSLM